MRAGNSAGQRLRVLMSADAVGGVWTYAIELARALAPLGVDVLLATLGPLPSPAQCAAASTIDSLRLLSRDCLLEWMPAPWSDVDAAGDWLLALERELAPDLVHINGYAHAALPFRAPVVSVMHSCVCSWWRAVHDCDAPASWDEYRRRVAAGLRAASVLVAPTAAISREIAHCYDLERSIRHIGNARRIEAKTVAKESFILSVGRLWDEAKNLQLLERSASRLRWPVYVAGSLEGGAMAGHRATSSVHTLGLLGEQEVVACMSRAAIYCLPARYEPFGLSILEAAQAGCALVIGDIASLREVWGDAAVFVPPADDAALASALEQLIADPERRTEMAERAQRRSRSYLPEPMAERYRALYDELRCGPRPTRSSTLERMSAT